MFFDVTESVAHALNLFGLIVRDFDAELFFKSHHQLDSVERICAQVVNEPRALGDFRFVHAEFIHNDLFYLFHN